MQTSTDRDGRVTRYTYDHLGRKISEEWLAADGVDVLRTISYSFDAAGRLTRASGPDSTATYTYDEDNRLTQIDLSYTGLSQALTVYQAYDASGNRLALLVQRAGVAEVVAMYDYDGLNRLTQVWQLDLNQTGNAIIGLTYDAAGQLQSTRRQEGLGYGSDPVWTYYGYDPRNLLTSLQHVLDTQGLQTLDYGFGYDDAGRMTSLSTPDGTSDLTYAAEKGTPEINVALETRHHLPMGHFSVAVAVVD